MRHPLSRAEALLATGATALAIFVVAGPEIRQPGAYHHFADQRIVFGLARAMDVWSNLLFAVAGLAGWFALVRAGLRGISNVQRAMAATFFTGLLLTAAGSSWYHLSPDEAGLAIDRTAMAVAFAGLLGLVTAGRVSERAGAALGLGLLVLGPVAAHVASTSGNVLSWASIQFGGMLLVLLLTLRYPRHGAIPVCWGAVVLAYAVAKLLEVGDAAVFELTGHWVSGHTLKHVVAAMAAIPVIGALGRAGESRQNALGATRTLHAGSAGNA